MQKEEEGEPTRSALLVLDFVKPSSKGIAVTTNAPKEGAVVGQSLPM
jgi:hypothetical protein